MALSDGHRVDVDLLLWGTRYGVDLSYFDSPAIRSIDTLGALAKRCGCIFRSLYAANLYFPALAWTVSARPPGLMRLCADR